MKLNKVQVLAHAEFMDILTLSMKPDNIDLVANDVAKFYDRFGGRYEKGILNAVLIRAIKTTRENENNYFNFPYLSKVLETFKEHRVENTSAAFKHLEKLITQEKYFKKKKRVGVVPDWYDEKEYEELLNNGN